MKVFLLDIGSTFIKYSVFDTDSQICTFTDKRPFPEPTVCDGVRFEVGESSLRAVLLEIADVAVENGCKRFFVSTQMHGYLLLENGTFSNYISWQDKRGDVTDPRLSGCDFSANGTSLKKNLPAVSLCTYGSDFDGVEFFTLGSYMSYITVGKNITHKTDACACGFFNADTLSRIDLFDSLALPTVTHGVIAVGEYKGMSVYTATGDHQISFLGSGASDKAYLLNIGTATQVCTLSDKGDACGTRCEKRPFFCRDKRLFTISGLTGGKQIFSDGLRDEFFDEILSAMSELPKKNKIVVGGGGGAIVFDQLCEKMAPYGIECELLNTNIGETGLKMIANDKKLKVGTMLSEIIFPNLPIIFKNKGLDFFIFDNEHGAFDYSTAAATIVNAKHSGIKCIVRLPDNNRMNIIKFADMGASGFLLPMTNCAADIKKVVEYAKYSPIGKRGLSTNRAHTLYNPPEIKTYMKLANEAMKVYAQIETRAGVENIDEILSVEGVEGVFIGPNDLSDDLGCIGDNQPIYACIDKVAAACEKHGKSWGIITANKGLLDHATSAGVGMVSVGSEINMLNSGCAKIKAMFE